MQSSSRDGSVPLELKTRVDPEHIHGEAGTGYTDEEAECIDCEYYQLSNSGCTGKAMKAKSRRPKNDDGTVKVAPGGHCVYFEKAEGKNGPWRKAAKS